MTTNKVCTALGLAVLSVGSLLASTAEAVNPATGQAALSGNYTYTGFSWKFLIDPLLVTQFQLSVEFDSTEAQFGSSENSFRFLNGYQQDLGVDPFVEVGTSTSILRGVAGINFEPPEGEVDVVEIEFIDLNPGLGRRELFLRAFADPNTGDFVQVHDPNTGQNLLFCNGAGCDGPVIQVMGILVPEPSSLLLVVMVLPALWACIRRRSRTL